MARLDTDLVLYWSLSCCGGFQGPYVGWFVCTSLRIFGGYPSLQVLRAETLVERFTARLTLRNKKVIRSQATGSEISKVIRTGNFEIMKFSRRLTLVKGSGV